LGNPSPLSEETIPGKEDVAMDTFTAIVSIAVVGMFVGFLVIGLFSRGRSVQDITDKDRHEQWVTQMKVEELDVPQMVSAANDYRRKRGMDEVTVEEFEAKVTDEQMKILDDANKQLQAHAATGGGAGRAEGRGF
jgi:hypothetical protein